MNRSWICIGVLSTLSMTGCPEPTGEANETGSINPDDDDDDDAVTTGGPAASTGTPDPDDGGTTVGMDTGDDDDDDPESPIKLDVNRVPDAPAGGFCPVITVESEPMVVPSDIIIAVDTSGSMSQEAQDVQDNLNAFSQQIVDAGVDARVVLIASGPTAFDGICIDAPLGNGGCPSSDDNEPLFLHVDQLVFSNDAYDLIINTYPQWQTIMRPEAVKQLLIVTDDNSWTNWEDFDASFVGLDPTHFGYTQHGIVSMSNCPFAAQVGQEYIDLAAENGGIIGDLCDQDFQPVFDELANAVVDNSIPCSYPLPDASGGPQDAETAEVQVDFGDGLQPVEPVETPAECEDDEDNWFFDDPLNPTSIIFCPQTCLRLKQTKDASVEIAITCAPASD